jgi:hypothetical protein
MNMERLLLILYLIGQLMEIYGAYLLYKYSSPPNAPKLPGAWLSAGNPTKEDFDKIKEYDKKYKLGFKFIAVGFLFQVPTTFFNLSK